METIEDIEVWFTAKRAPQLPDENVVQLLHAMHPRTIFLKTLPVQSNVLDLGAGEGSAQVFRAWLIPKRLDLKMYAFSLSKGVNFDKYDGFELGDWESDPPTFPGVNFDALFCSHFIEHIRDPLGVVRWASAALSDRGSLYLEWPSPFSEKLPTKFDLGARGIDVMISRFSDDGTHLAVHDRTAITAALKDAGFLIKTEGYVSFPALENDLLLQPDSYCKLAAYWSKTKWAQYVVAERLAG